MKKITPSPTAPARLVAPALRSVLGQVAADANPTAAAPSATAPAVISVSSSNIDTALSLGPR